MNQQKLEELYHIAASKCHENKSWLFERQFAEAIINECIDVIIGSDPSEKCILHEPYRTVVNNITDHFFVNKHDNT